MTMNRRKFLTLMGSAGVGSTLGTARTADAGTHSFPGHENSYGVLHDTTRCIGCRRCEEACNKVNGLPKPDRPFSDLAVCDTRRRTSAGAWTVVNKYQMNGKAVFRKHQCFHCNDPACASACFARCFRKQPDGSVTYDGSQCVGCRYCMVACPFYAPGFQYDEPFDPLVQKCTFCKPRLDKGLLPGCVEACPVQALTFGRRNDCIKAARKRIEAAPGKYLDYIYGEWDAGGTAWMVLAPANEKAPVPPGNPVKSAPEWKQLGLDSCLGNRPLGELTYGALGIVPMIVALWPVFLGGAWAMTRRREAEHEEEMEGIVREAGRDVAAALDAAVREIGRQEGEAAADRAREAMARALKAREAEARGEDA